MSAALVDHCRELLAPLGAVRVRRMFGGHGFYVDELFVALIAFDRLFLKVDAQTRPAFEAAGSVAFVYEGRGRAFTVGSWWSAPADAMESPAEMLHWGRLALGAALRARQDRRTVKPAARRAARPASKPTGRAG